MVVTILEVRGDIIRVGVDAPRHIQVRRQELLSEVAETNRAAASPQADVVARLSRHVKPAPEGESPEKPAE